MAELGTLARDGVMPPERPGHGRTPPLLAARAEVLAEWGGMMGCGISVMDAHTISDQLRQIAAVPAFPGRSAELLDAWQFAKAGIESVEPILAFMETYPEIDFGTPGPLVHFVETFHGRGYEERLAASLQRRPTSMTVWMLNRLINGAQLVESRREWIAMMRSAGNHVLADFSVRLQVAHFMEQLSLADGADPSAL